MISVVITCYNLEAYIAEAIESVLGQRDTGKVEIIVVDDCSTDGSAKIIRGYPGVRYLCTAENGGVMLAMLAGVEAAGGDVICLLDGDDVWEPDKLSLTNTAFAVDRRVALVTHDLTYIDGRGMPIDRPSRPARRLSPLPDGARGAEVRKGILELGDYVWLGSALSFRRSLIDWPAFAALIHTQPYPRNIYQDWPLAYWIATQEEAQLAYIDQPLFRYRLHRANHSGDARTINRALRNFDRTRNTMTLIAAIADRQDVAQRLKQIAKQRLRFGIAQVDLYRGRRLRALAGLIRALPMLVREQRLGKEVVRFLASTVVGPTMFVRLASGRAQSGSEEGRAQP